jgi:hypothetical protein
MTPPRAALPALGLGRPSGVMAAGASARCRSVVAGGSSNVKLGVMGCRGWSAAATTSVIERARGAGGVGDTGAVRRQRQSVGWSRVAARGGGEAREQTGDRTDSVMWRATGGVVHDPRLVGRSICVGQ